MSELEMIMVKNETLLHDFCLNVWFSLSDAISSANPRVIDDSRARKLSNELKRCTYYETCATYGLNVERVFQDGKKLSESGQRRQSPVPWEGDIPPPPTARTEPFGRS